MKFGEVFKEKRLEKKMSQKKVADLLFVTRQTISKWENGQRYPDYDTVNQISKVLGVSANELLGQDELDKSTTILNSRRKKNYLTTIILSISNGILFLTTLCLLLPSFFHIKTPAKYNEVQADDMVSFTIPFYSLYLSAWSGLPVVIDNSNENAIAECTFDGGSFSGTEKIISKKINMGEEFYWIQYDCEQDKNVSHGYIEIILKSRSTFIGYGVIEINEGEDLSYLPIILAAKVFPKINGVYQNIPEEYVLKKIREVKQK